jgi:N-acetylglucosamine-6-sulfatase
VLGEQALKFLDQDRDKPFFLHFSPRAPHGPATPDKLDAGEFKTIDLPVPPSFNEQDVADKPAVIRRLRPISDKNREDLELFRRRELETLLSVDRALGNIVDKLTTDGRINNTWIIFTSDNGMALGEHRLDVTKTCAYEECVRVPLAVVPPPGTSAPGTLDQLVGNIDLAPTIAQILGAQPGLPLDGSSLLPIISDTSTPWRDSIMIEVAKADSSDEFVGVRTAEHKYVRYPSGDEELYDEQPDPYELQNLASQPELAEEKARMARKLEEITSTRPLRR